jgi:serine/threonine protein kinase|tara:strand:+ start:128 stop:547 length:420 start_codon:yes stop_codon:yes gene_type:complete
MEKQTGKDIKKEEKKVTKEADDGTMKDTHAYMVLGTRFEIDKRYEIIDPIGSGAYGVVVAAKDTSLPETDGQSNLVAIKKIVKAFEHRVFSLRTYRELKIQRLLEHENVLGIKRILKPKDRKGFNEIYVISELMETDLA